MTFLQFQALPLNNFYDSDADVQLLTWLKISPFKNLLDYDGHFFKSQILSTGANDLTKIDAVFEEKIFPLKKNIYCNVYQKYSDCILKHYDAILIEERVPFDFDKTFFTLDNSAEAVITFAKYNSELQKHILTTQNNFAKIEVLRSFAGHWIILYRHKPPEDFSIYVVTHKALPPEHVEKIPEGYKIIHAGRILSQDLGYVGDNTGDNISFLNPYVNEITALYWMWKNSANTITGLSHYRRFFTDSPDLNFNHEKILTAAAATEILKSYDIILSPHYDNVTQFENISGACSFQAADLAKNILLKNIEKFQPQYSEAFNFVMNTKYFYKCNMFITRRNVFDAYCKWLFSFLPDSLQEILQIAPESHKRLTGYFAERMMSVWILKNNLRIKELQIMQVPGM